MWVVCQFTGSRFPHVATRKRQNRKSIPPPGELSCVFYASTFLMIMIIINPIPTCSQSTGTGTGTGSLPLAATTTTTHHQQLTTTTTTTATATTTTSAGLQGHDRPPAEPTADPHISTTVMCVYMYTVCASIMCSHSAHTHTYTKRNFIPRLAYACSVRGFVSVQICNSTIVGGRKIRHHHQKKSLPR